MQFLKNIFKFYLVACRKGRKQQLELEEEIDITYYTLILIKNVVFAIIWHLSLFFFGNI